MSPSTQKAQYVNKITLFGRQIVSAEMRNYKNNVKKYVSKRISLRRSSRGFLWRAAIFSSQLRVPLRIHQQGLSNMADDHTAVKQKKPPPHRIH